MGKKKQNIGAGPSSGKKSSFNHNVKKAKKNALQKQDQDHILQDDRFSRIATDPRFRGIPAVEKRVTIDQRFKSMFTDKRFDQKHTVDKRGRPVNFASSDNLKKFYHLDESSAKNNRTDAEGSSSSHTIEDDRFKLKAKETPESSDSSDSDEDDDGGTAKDLARGKGNMESSSEDSEDESAEDEDDSREEVEHAWAEFSHDAPPTEEITHRLALVNMDWDSIKAEDIFSLLNSFKPAQGVIRSVKIYPSEYGTKRLEEEKKSGPIALSATGKDEEEEEGVSKARSNEQLRQYQLNRLKYYYAVVECDGPETANKIYEECDGLEYGNSSTVVDLRFIPDDMEFEREAKSGATSLPANYTASEFVNSALQQSTVKCSWDETPRDRKGLPAVAADWAKQDDLQAYLASSSEEEEEEDIGEHDGNADTRSVFSTRSMKDPEAIEKYRAMILGLDSNDKSADEISDDGDVDLEVDWEPGLKSSAQAALQKKQNDANAEKLTPFEKILEKQALNRKARKSAKERQNSPDFDSALANESDDDLVDSEEEEGEEEVQGVRGVREVQGVQEDAVGAADLELLVGDVGGKRHFNLTKLMTDAEESKSQRKRKRRKLEAAGKLAVATVDEQPDDFTMDLDDQRFSALYTSNQFNLDMSDPFFKKTKGMDALVKEKLKRRALGGAVDSAPSSSTAALSLEGRKIRPEISSLAKSVKAKMASEKLKK